MTITRPAPDLRPVRPSPDEPRPDEPRPDEARLLGLLDARAPAHSLPGPCYTDPALHEVDLRLVWQRQWFFVGTVAEVPEAGDFKFTWYDDDGSVYEEVKSIAIG